MMGSREVVPPLDVLCVGDAEAFCCGICYSIYEEATILVPCGHSFCEGCVKYVRQRQVLHLKFSIWSHE